MADRALYTAETLPLLREVHGITRVPATLKAAQAARRQMDPETMTHLDEHTRCQRLNTAYAGVSQRWLVVYSEAAPRRARKSVSRQCLKYTEADAKAFGRLCAQSLAGASRAEQALAAFGGVAEHPEIQCVVALHHDITKANNVAHSLRKLD